MVNFVHKIRNKKMKQNKSPKMVKKNVQKNAQCLTPLEIFFLIFAIFIFCEMVDFELKILKK